MSQLLIRGGIVIDGEGREPYRADILVSGGIISGIGPDLDAPGAIVLDAAGAFVTPGLYRVQGGEATLAEELFGPHVSFERAADLDDACRRAADTPFGLSASLFSADPAAWEAFYDLVPAGVVNINRSTNGASGLLPFGGVGMSGNWRPAGSLAPRNATYPVAYMRADLGARTPNAALDGQLGDNP